MKRLAFLSIMSILILVTPAQVVSSAGNSLGDGGAEGAAITDQGNSFTGIGNPADVIVQGVYLPPINKYGTEILAFNDLVGKDLGIVHYYVDMFYRATSASWLVDNIQMQVPEQRYPAVMFTWLPAGRDCRTTPPDKDGTAGLNISLYDIISGYCDSYIRLVAQHLKEEPFTFLIRFAHEMNISGSPWWAGYYNNDPQVYIDAYRHVHDAFMSEGVTNVQWVWAPNFASYPQEEWNSFYNYYPGDEYVDWVGLIGYNWGEWWSMPWWSLAEIFDFEWDHIISETSCRYAKPIMLETASVEGSRPGDGTKAEWTEEGYQQLDLFPFVKAIVWFNDWDRADPSRADLRVVGTSYRDPDPWHVGYAYPLPEGDGSWTEAYRTAIARDKFISYVPPLEDITPPTTWCGGEPVFETPDVIYARPGETKTFTISAMGLMEDMDISLNGLPPQVDAVLNQPFLLKPWDKVQVRLEVGPKASLGTSDIAISLTSAGYGIQQVRIVKLVIADKFYRAYLPLVSTDQ